MHQCINACQKKSVHTQQKLYGYHDVSTTTSHNFSAAQNAYENGQYKHAAFLAKGALEYAKIMNIHNQAIINNTLYILVDCHINQLSSPQHALQELDAIHDVETRYGIMTSEKIAKQLSAHAQKMPSMATKLNEYAAQYRTLAYEHTYKNQSAETLIQALKKTALAEEQQVLLAFIKQHAFNGHLLSQVILANAHYQGLYGITRSLEQALPFALAYAKASIFQKNTYQLPLERFCITQIFKESADLLKQRNIIDHLYHDYFTTTQSNGLNAGKNIFTTMQQFPDEQKELRNILFNCLTDQAKKGQTLNAIIKLEAQSNFKKMIRSFIQSDGIYFAPLCEYLIQNKPLPDALCYALGLLYYYSKHYTDAFLYLTKSSLYATDLLTQCRALKAYMQYHPLLTYKNAAKAIQILKTLFLSKKDTPRNTNALEKRIKLLSRYALDLSETLLMTKHNYKEVLSLASLCLQNTETYDIGLSIISSVYKKFIANKKDLAALEPFLQPIKQHWNTHHDQKSLTCLQPIIAYHIITQQKIDLKKDLLLQITVLEGALKQKVHQKNKAELEKLCGILYYTLSKQSPQEEKKQALRKAIDYYHQEALLELAILINQEKTDAPDNAIITNDQMVEEAFLPFQLHELAYDTTAAPATRLKAFELLIAIGAPNKATMAQHLQNAYALGSKKYLNELACVYLHGVYHADAKDWFIKPDPHKARELLEEAVKRNNTLRNRFELGMAYVKCGTEYHNKAIPLLREMTCQTDPTLKTKKQQSYMLLCDIMLHNLTPQGITQAYKCAEESEELGIFMLLIMDNERYTAFADYTKKVLARKNTQPYAIQACTLFGYIFYNNKQQDPTFSLEDDHAHACLKYAAENNNLKAQFLIVYKDIITINRWEKCIYIERLAKSNYVFCKIFDKKTIPLSEQFVRYAPKNIHEQYECLTYSHKRFDPNKPHFRNFLNFCISSGYLCSIPDASFTTTDNELAQKFYENPLFTSYLKRFDQDCTQPNNNKGRKHMCLISMSITGLYVYALMNSNDQKLVEISISYAEKLLEFEGPNDRTMLKKMLVSCYDKMASFHQADPEKSKIWQEKKDKLIKSDLVMYVAPVVVGTRDVTNAEMQQATSVVKTFIQEVNKSLNK